MYISNFSLLTVRRGLGVLRKQWKNTESIPKSKSQLENYVVDFCCPKVKLIVELDGSGHLSPKAKKKDQERDKRLEGLGYHIIRFYNNEIDESMDGVLTIISDKCKELSNL